MAEYELGELTCTIETAVDRFSESLRQREVSPNTLRAYTSTFNKYLLPVYGSMNVEDFSKEDAEKVLDWLRENGRYPSTLLNTARTFPRFSPMLSNKNG
ncbi:site-specific integrase [Arcanobacterium phocae]|uniref:site-specific integrase n=1 Tax=Arcanobacterium phocae TaxID=131112 RepID=UPI001C0EA8C4|nr:site-specific integrase [Arcanobacterium phocae]